MRRLRGSDLPCLFHSIKARPTMGHGVGQRVGHSHLSRKLTELPDFSMFFGEDCVQ